MQTESGRIAHRGRKACLVSRLCLSAFYVKLKASTTVLLRSPGNTKADVFFKVIGRALDVVVFMFNPGITISNSLRGFGKLSLNFRKSNLHPSVNVAFMNVGIVPKTKLARCLSQQHVHLVVRCRRAAACNPDAGREAFRSCAWRWGDFRIVHCTIAKPRRELTRQATVAVQFEDGLHLHGRALCSLATHFILRCNWKAKFHGTGILRSTVSRICESSDG